METDADGTPTQVARRSEDAFESYEAALAAGTRALNAQLHPPTPAGTWAEVAVRRHAGASRPG